MKTIALLSKSVPLLFIALLLISSCSKDSVEEKINEEIGTTREVVSKSLKQFELAGI